MGRISPVVALLVALAACTDDGSAPATSTSSRSTSTTRPPSPAPYTRVGPYPVGAYTAEVDGHLVFTDLCAMGKPFQTAAQLPPAIASFRSLLAQGCTNGFPPVRTDQPVIDDLSVDFLRTTLGLQDHPGRPRRPGDRAGLRRQGRGDRGLVDSEHARAEDAPTGRRLLRA